MNKRKTTHSIFSYFEEIISRKIEAEKIGYSDTFKATLLKLKNYRQNKDLEFSDVTYAFITKYDEWLNRQGLEPNSIFPYLRTFNTALNYAKKDKLVKDDYSPFKEFSFSKYRRAKTKKRAISKEEMMLYDYLMGNEFKKQLKTIHDTFVQMYTSLAKEKKTALVHYKKREKEIDRIMLNLSGIAGSINGIAGQTVAEFAEFEVLEEDLALLE